MSAGVLDAAKGGVFVAISLVGRAEGVSVESEDGIGLSRESSGKPGNVQDVSKTRQSRKVTIRDITSREWRMMVFMEAFG